MTFLTSWHYIQAAYIIIIHPQRRKQQSYWDKTVNIQTVLLNIQTFSSLSLCVRVCILQWRLCIDESGGFKPRSVLDLHTDNDQWTELRKPALTTHTDTNTLVITAVRALINWPCLQRETIATSHLLVWAWERRREKRWRGGAREEEEMIHGSEWGGGDNKTVKEWGRE